MAQCWAAFGALAIDRGFNPDANLDDERMIARHEAAVWVGGMPASHRLMSLVGCVANQPANRF
jgi:hypothetical protein